MISDIFFSNYAFRKPPLAKSFFRGFFLDPAETQKTTMAFSFFGDLENAAFQKNLFFSARPRSVFSLSFFLVFEGV